MNEYNVNKYNQAAALNLLKKDDFESFRRIGSGACLGLSLQWIRMHMDLKSSKWNNHQAFRSLSSRIEYNQIEFISAITGVISAAASTVSSARDVQKAMEHFRLRYSMRPLLNNNFPETENLPNDFKLNCNRYAVIVFTGLSAAGSHAVAFYRSGGTMGVGKLGGPTHYYIFEPNLGEYKVPSGSITTFLGDLCRYEKETNNFNRYIVWDVTN